MITFIAIFLTMLTAAAVILRGCLAGYVWLQLREASRVDVSRQLSLKPTTERNQTLFGHVGLMWIERPTHAHQEEATHSTRLKVNH